VKAQAALRPRPQDVKFLVVGAGHTKSGHPLAVMGPSWLLFYPEIVFRRPARGGIDADGAVPRSRRTCSSDGGRDYAWSLTSSSSQNT